MRTKRLARERIEVSNLDWLKQGPDDQRHAPALQPCGGGDVIAGLLATWIPAPRALAIEPSILMREERKTLDSSVVGNSRSQSLFLEHRSFVSAVSQARARSV
jgi:hypothetical protein